MATYRLQMLLCGCCFMALAQQRPAPLQPTSDDPIGRERREIRNKWFDFGIQGPRLDELGPTPVRPAPMVPAPPANVVVTSALTPAEAELPAARSDLVAIGQVISEQPFLSHSHRAIYTEYTVRVDNMINSTSSVRTGDTIAVVRLGGQARLPNQIVIAHELRGAGDPPVVGAQYLLFLQYRPTGDAYTIVKVWGVQDGFLRAVSPDDVARVHNRIAMNEGKPVTEAIAAVKTYLRNRGR